jgi:ribosomal protein S27E
MNPFAWIIAETVARTKLEMLTRRCPRCGRKQVVPEEKLTTEVKCARCGAGVPPAPEFKRRRS